MDRRRGADRVRAVHGGARRLRPARASRDRRASSSRGGKAEESGRRRRGVDRGRLKGLREALLPVPWRRWQGRWDDGRRSRSQAAGPHRRRLEARLERRRNLHGD